MIYTSTTKYVDKETGQQLNKKTAKKHYIKIKTNKHVTTQWTEGKCTIEYTHICERNRQGKLFSE